MSVSSTPANEAPIPPVSERLGYIRPSRELLEYYRTKIAEYDGDYENLVKKIEKYRIVTENMSKSLWEVRQREDEIRELQKALSDMQVFLFQEREHVLRLFAENDRLKIKELEDRKRIQHLLSLTVPVNAETTYFLKEPPAKVIIHQHNKAKLGQNRGAGGHKKSKNPPESVVQDDCDTLNQSDSHENLLLTVEALKSQLEEQTRLCKEQVDALLEDRRVHMEESEALHERNTARIQNLADQLHTTQNMLYDSTKDYLDLKYDFRLCERAWMTEKDKILNELDHYREKLDISEGVDPLLGVMVNRDKDSESHSVPSFKLLQLHLQQSQQVSDNYREQCISMEQELCQLREQVEASKDVFKQRSGKMAKRLALMNGRYEALEGRRKLEIEGYKTDIKLLRQRLKEVEKQLYKLTLTLGGDQDMQILSYVKKTSHNSKKLIGDLQNLKAKIYSLENDVRTMPGRGAKGAGGLRPKKKAFKPKQQKKRFIRSKDPILAVLMWGVQHSINELTTSVEPSLLLSEDFKAFSKLRVENQYYNKENLPGHFKFKEYCPRVFHNLRKRFGMDDLEYMNSLVVKPPLPIDSPGRSGSKFFLSYDKKLIMKSISSEEVALLHQILQPYHGHVVTSENTTLLPHYLGCYRLTVNNAESYWLVMRSVFSSFVTMHRKFDLKGSTVDRQASDKEKAKSNPTLKDLDFTESGKKIYIGSETRERVMKSLELDVQLLQKLNLMDYSYLVGIHDCSIPPSPDEDNGDDYGEEDGYDYISSDEVNEPPLSPTEEVLSSDDIRQPALTTGSISPETNSDCHRQVDVLSPTSPLVVSDTEQEGPEISHISGDDSDQRPAPQASAATGEVAEHYQCSPALVRGEKEMELAVSEGKSPVIDTMTDVFAIISASDTKPEVYYMGIIDVLTNYGARKRAAHAAKTMKHGAGAEFSTVKPDQYARRFVEFISKSIV